MAIIEDLLNNTGLYFGIGRSDQPEAPPWVGRLKLEALPGGGGVALDYEATSAEHRLQHAEHSMLGRTAPAETILLVGYIHTAELVLLPETEPGFFSKPRAAPGQLGIRIEVTGPGRIRHAYCRRDADGSWIEFDVADLVRAVP